MSAPPVEYLDLVDESNQIVGKAPRREVRTQNLLHRGVGILCWNSQGQIYVHQRTSTKDLFPSMFDVMVGGAVEAGEAYLPAARREIQEELGVESTDLRFILEHLYDGPKNRSFIHLFEVNWDGPIRWQPEEIVWGDWMDFDEAVRWSQTVDVVPDGLEVFQAYLAWRQSQQ
jgi:isopentenyldiphosphate isomerase